MSAAQTARPTKPHTSALLPVHRRQAKSFRERILASDQETAGILDRVNAEAKAILQRRRTFRPEILDGFLRTWETEIPDTARCGLVVARSKGTLTIADCRLHAGRFRRNDWDDPTDFEMAVALNVVQFRLGPGIHLFKSLPLATISDHALARRYERGFINSDQAICRDAGELALQLKALLKQQPRFQCSTEHGNWVGNVLTAKNGKRTQRLLAVRTYV